MISPRGVARGRGSDLCRPGEMWGKETPLEVVLDGGGGGAGGTSCGCWGEGSEAGGLTRPFLGH